MTDTTQAVGVTKDQIRSIFMAHGFTIKDGQTDLKDYVYKAADALIRAALAAQAVPDMRDAYVGAREDLQIWKRRALVAERQLREAQGMAVGWTDADSDAARLALELECLLLDKDIPLPATSRWWASANEALDLHRKRLAASPTPAEAKEEPRNTATHRHLSALIGLWLGARQRGDFKYAEGSAVDKAVKEAIEHLKDWPYSEAAPALTEEQERDVFEEWAINDSMRIDRWQPKPDFYDDEETQASWNGWKARAAAMPEGGQG